MNVELFESPWGGYTISATNPSGDKAMITTQIFYGVIYLQKTSNDQIESDTCDLFTFASPGQTHALAFMMHSVLWSCERFLPNDIDLCFFTMLFEKLKNVDEIVRQAA